MGMLCNQAFWFERIRVEVGRDGGFVEGGFYLRPWAGKILPSHAHAGVTKTPLLPESWPRGKWEKHWCLNCRFAVQADWLFMKISVGLPGRGNGIAGLYKAREKAGCLFCPVLPDSPSRRVKLIEATINCSEWNLFWSDGGGLVCWSLWSKYWSVGAACPSRLLQIPSFHLPFLPLI